MKMNLNPEDLIIEISGKGCGNDRFVEYSNKTGRPIIKLLFEKDYADPSRGVFTISKVQPCGEEDTYLLNRKLRGDLVLDNQAVPLFTEYGKIIYPALLKHGNLKIDCYEDGDTDFVENSFKAHILSDFMKNKIFKVDVDKKTGSVYVLLVADSAVDK